MSDQIGRVRRWYVYRLYDADDALLYVGSTSNVKRRLSEHRPKTWFARVESIETDQFTSRWRAALAERSHGRGEHNWLHGGIGRALAAAMTDDELTFALSHPAYAKAGDGEMARHWKLPIAEIRRLRLPR